MLLASDHIHTFCNAVVSICNLEASLIVAPNVASS